MTTSKPETHSDPRPGVIVEGELYEPISFPFLRRPAVLRGVEQRPSYRWWVLVSVLSGLFATGLTITVLTTAVPEIRSDFGASLPAVSWVVSAPFLFRSIFVPVFGKAGDLLGRRRMWVLGFAVSSGAALLCGFAPNLGSLILFRAVSAIGSAAVIPSALVQIDVEEYRSPAALPPGPVLVIGSGQSGCQIAEELHLAGRETFLACGRAPWAPRRIGALDVDWWAIETGLMDASVDALPGPAARLTANMLGTGQEGGRDLNLRTLQQLGVTLLGHFQGAEQGRARFAPDLAESIAWGDERYQQFTGLVRKLAAERGLPEPEVPEPKPFSADGSGELDLRGLGAVVHAGGFRPDYQTWTDLPGAFDELGFPIQEDGASAVFDGLYFVGVHFLRKRKSSLLLGVGEDAAIVARSIAARQRVGRTR